MQARRIVDLERYPIEDLEAPATRELIEACRDDLDRQALCLLPGFVRPDALREMTLQAGELAPRAYRKDNLRTSYGWMCNEGFPADHPRSALHPNRGGYLLSDQFSGDGIIEGLFHWDPLTEFVQQVLGFRTLFRSACPYLSLMVNVMGEGDRLGWHFDTNDGVVSLLLQQADDGGHFEYAPYIRAESDENYPTLKRLFDGEEGIARRPAFEPGTFVLFKGRRACHRVTTVGPTAKPRMTALFSYDEKPGMVLPELTVRDFKTPSPEPYRGQPG